MPALDRCHPQVVRALEKEGWQIMSQPLALLKDRRRIFIDIEAVQQRNGSTRHVLLVEVKCFAEQDALTTEVYIAIGQYLVYQTLLKQLQSTLPLYLAFPDTVYTQLDPIILMTLAEYHIQQMVVDLEREVILRWTS
jgi:hypothetical protein